MKNTLILFFLIFCSIRVFSQASTDQNGIKSTVIDQLATGTPQAMRFDVGAIAYNTHHWQDGGLVIVELFHQYFQTGYEKYVIEVGLDQGADVGSPVIKLIESLGNQHNAKITLGSSYDLTTSYAGFINRALPIYVDINGYSRYRVRISYLQNKVDVLTDPNQIKINATPSGIALADFVAPTILDNNITSSKNLVITGSGTHYIQNGNLAIGTTNPQGHRLAVAGNMIAESVKVKLQSAWPDYVFAKDYELPSLQSTEQDIKNTGHLPGIPSAAEAKANGLDLGDMNAKLLQKIEELTLHLIEKDKQLKAERATNDIQELRLKNLEDKIDQLIEKTKLK